jgi:type I restriction enzyme, S subunit
MSGLPPGWAAATLGDLCEVVSGSTPRTTVPQYWGGDVAWITPDDLSRQRSKTIAKGARNITQTGYESCSTRLVPPGTVLYTSRAPIGYVAIAVGPVCTNQGFKSFVPSEALTSDYLYWFLVHATPAIRELGSGTTFPELSKAAAKSIRVPVSPLNEQRRIVAAIEEQFSRLDAAEASLRRAQTNLQPLRSSVVTSSIEGEWPRLRWKEVGRAQNGRAFPSRDYSADGVKLLRPGNLHASGRVVWTPDNTRRLPASYEQQRPELVVGPKELVMNLTAQSLKDEFLGRVCLTGPGEHCLLNQRLARLTPHEADPKYLLYVFKTRPFRRFVDSLNKGSLIQHMFISQLDEFEVPLPPLEEQRRIVATIERQLSLIDALSISVDTSLRRVAIARRAILERAFRGELVPQDPADEPASVLLERICPERAADTVTPRRRPVRSGR